MSIAPELSPQLPDFETHRRQLPPVLPYERDYGQLASATDSQVDIFKNPDTQAAESVDGSLALENMTKDELEAALQQLISEKRQADSNIQADYDRQISAAKEIESEADRRANAKRQAAEIQAAVLESPERTRADKIESDALEIKGRIEQTAKDEVARINSDPILRAIHEGFSEEKVLETAAIQADAKVAVALQDAENIRLKARNSTKPMRDEAEAEAKQLIESAYAQARKMKEAAKITFDRLIAQNDREFYSKSRPIAIRLRAIENMENDNSQEDRLVRKSRPIRLPHNIRLPKSRLFRSALIGSGAVMALLSGSVVISGGGTEQHISSGDGVREDWRAPDGLPRPVDYWEEAIIEALQRPELFVESEAGVSNTLAGGVGADGAIIESHSSIAYSSIALMSAGHDDPEFGGPFDIDPELRQQIAERIDVPVDYQNPKNNILHALRWINEEADALMNNPERREVYEVEFDTFGSQDNFLSDLAAAIGIPEKNKNIFMDLNSDDAELRDAAMEKLKNDPIWQARFDAAERDLVADGELED